MEKMNRHDSESDIEDLKFGLGIHITREDLNKKYGVDDLVCRNVLVGEWENKERRE